MSWIKLKQAIPNALAIITISVFFLYLIRNINYVKVPNSDLFQYIEEGYWYLKFKFPPLGIKGPPLSAIFIGLFSKLLSFLNRPELTASHMINIISATLSLVNIFLIFRKNKPWIGFFTVILLATNKIYITNSLNITNEVLYTYFFTLVILLHLKKHYRLTYLICGIAFLARYEAIILPIIIFTSDLLSKNKNNKFKNIIFAIIPITITLIILNFHSYGSSIIQNHYIAEMISGKSNIPNPQPIESTFDILLSNSINYFYFINFHPEIYPSIPEKTINIIFSIIILILCLIKIIPRKTDSTTKIIFLSLIGHIAFVSIFPNFSIRYLFPIFWIVYLSIIYRKNKFITVIFTIILMFINLKTINKYSIYDAIFDKSEDRLVAEWIDQQHFTEQTYIVMFEPFITEYYLKDKPINISFNDKNILDVKDEKFASLLNGCHDDTLCLMETLYNVRPDNSQFFFISTTASSPDGDIDQLDDQFFIKQNHLKVFREQNLSCKDKKFLKLVTVLRQDDYHWAKIYQYQPR